VTKESRGSLIDTLTALGNTVRSMNAIVPGIAAMVVLLSVGVIAISILSLTVIVGVLVLIATTVAIVVYVQRRNFAEAAVALAAGLYAALAINWTGGKFIASAAAWLSLTLFVMLFNSVRLAATEESIYTEASNAQREAENLQINLQEIGRRRSRGTLGPIEKAEVIRLFAYKGMPGRSIPRGLDMVEVYSTILRQDHTTVASFVVDLARIHGDRFSTEHEQVRDEVYRYFKQSYSTPSEFLTAFARTRSKALSSDWSPSQYFDRLSQALRDGVDPGEAMIAFAH
jgi:hypothetical protein